MKTFRTDCLVIGSGLAGSAYALRAASLGLSVDLLSLADPMAANSVWAQGGIIYDRTDDPQSCEAEIRCACKRLCRAYLTKTIFRTLTCSPDSST